MNKLLVDEQMMKRAISFLLIAAFYVAGWGQEFSIGGKGNMMTFRISGNNEVSVVPTKEKYTSASCEIPAVVEWQGNQYAVTRIAEKAFYKSKMSGVTIPNTVKNIDVLAFGLCRNLVSVTFQEGLEKIGISAFEVASISRVIIPTTVRSIGNYAFLSLVNVGMGTKLKTLSIPNTNIEIGEHAFNRSRNPYGAWGTSQCEVLSLPDWVTAEQAKTFGIHEDSYNNYITKKNGGALPVAATTATGQAVVSATPTVATPIAQPTPIQQDSPVSHSETVVSASLSDVDQNIPHTSSTNENTFAIIIANEKYDREVEVQFACNDGRTFKRYCEETLGIPVENVHYRENATLNNIIAEVDWLKKVC
ncbi:MAG: leucine-rich repeat domain-containing protein, partial [Bacteroidaceae bacterium]|nr:leucine-rich repeat domain-containing protein [Bacteroidaceae bacterium]